MDWIHCNVCFNQPTISSSGEQQYHLTSCGHIFCGICKCYANEYLKTCKICKQRCSIIKLDSETNREVLKYFDEPENILRHLLEIMKFQKCHQTKLLKHQRYISQKCGRVKQYIKQLENELKMVNANLKITSASCSQQSPYMPRRKIESSSSVHLDMMADSISKEQKEKFGSKLKKEEITFSSFMTLPETPK